MSRLHQSSGSSEWEPPSMRAQTLTPVFRVLRVDSISAIDLLNSFDAELMLAAAAVSLGKALLTLKAGSVRSAIQAPLRFKMSDSRRTSGIGMVGFHRQNLSKVYRKPQPHARCA